MRRPLIGGDYFEASIGQGEQAQGKVMEAYKWRGKSFGWKKKKVLFMREMCARIKHGKISMTKPLEFYFK